jgi:hypothetical protein
MSSLSVKYALTASGKVKIKTYLFALLKSFTESLSNGSLKSYNLPSLRG